MNDYDHTHDGGGAITQRTARGCDCDPDNLRRRRSNAAPVEGRSSRLSPQRYRSRNAPQPCDRIATALLQAWQNSSARSKRCARSIQPFSLSKASFSPGDSPAVPRFRFHESFPSRASPHTDHLASQDRKSHRLKIISITTVMNRGFFRAESSCDIRAFPLADGTQISPGRPFFWERPMPARPLQFLP